MRSDSPLQHLVQRLLESYEVEIGVDSEVGEGTTFRLDIPLRDFHAT